MAFAKKLKEMKKIAFLKPNPTPATEGKPKAVQEPATQSDSEEPSSATVADVPQKKKPHATGADLPQKKKLNTLKNLFKKGDKDVAPVVTAETIDPADETQPVPTSKRNPNEKQGNASKAHAGKANAEIKEGDSKAKVARSLAPSSQVHGQDYSRDDNQGDNQGGYQVVSNNQQFHSLSSNQENNEKYYQSQCEQSGSVVASASEYEESGKPYSSTNSVPQQRNGATAHIVPKAMSAGSNKGKNYAYLTEGRDKPAGSKRRASKYAEGVVEDAESMEEEANEDVGGSGGSEVFVLDHEEEELEEDDERDAQIHRNAMKTENSLQVTNEAKKSTKKANEANKVKGAKSAKAAENQTEEKEANSKEHEAVSKEEGTADKQENSNKGNQFKKFLKKLKRPSNKEKGASGLDDSEVQDSKITENVPRATKKRKENERNLDEEVQSCRPAKFNCACGRSYQMIAPIAV